MSEPTSPDHYKQGKMETWDWIERGLTDEEFTGYLIGNVYKYIQRYESKNGEEDLKKAQVYLKKLIDFKYPKVKIEEGVEIVEKPSWDSPPDSALGR